MKKRLLLYIIVLAVLNMPLLNGQKDNEPPVSPVLTLVTVDYKTGNTDLKWNLSPSADVAAYVVYSFSNNEGYPLDTIFNPLATAYTRYGTGSSYFSESYVVAAMDASGNISPLSNSLRTIFAVSAIDTCRNRLDIKWNSYISSPLKVLNYTILQSVNGAAFIQAAQVAADKTSFTITDFQADAVYCFVISAGLEGGINSTSNRSCLSTRMQRPPVWINADYATVNSDNRIKLSFSIDPSSEIKSYILERKTGYKGVFAQISQFSSVTGSLSYIDNQADVSRINFYRLSAINNCNIPASMSNISSNIVLSAERNDNDIKLTWNPYRKWNGSTDGYKVHAAPSGRMEERYSAGSSDTVFMVSYTDLMYEITGKEVCFMVSASESGNPYNAAGESQSQAACIPVSEIITVPNLFTPDNNGINDYFRPVFSFTPDDYHLIITDASRKTVFETDSYSDRWDGTLRGNHLPEGIYMWFLKLKTPSGSIIERTGTVTIKLTR